ncbi:VIR protein [Plasmodium vivax]|uniref:VIR protein n=1 Tax=Plasmodium vivax TaxID=5855 RepID=A0A1G4EBW9_PLAVI|nr:VIR protein [Plasmodium vivax]
MSGPNIKQWDEIDGLYTGMFYDELERSRTSSRYNDYCRSPKSLINDNSLVRIVCATILKYLETKYSKSDHTNDRYDACKLLNYWVYKRLNTILSSKSSIYINQVHGDIVLKWNSFNDDILGKPENYTCKPIDSIVVYNDWEKRKELYDYYVDYDQIKQYIQFDPKNCKEFRQYIESKKQLYKHFKERCTTRDINRCPEFYDQCKKYDPDEVLPHPDCKGVIMQETATAASRLPLKINGHPFKESESDEESDDMKAFGAPKLNENSNNVRTYGNVLLGVVATSMTSGALYRFTPLGGMIRNGLGWNTNNMSNINGGDIRLYDYASEPFNPYPGEEHYIGYHPP